MLGYLLFLCCILISGVLLLGYNLPALLKLKDIPGPNPAPFFGHYLKASAGFVHYRFLIDWPKQYGKIYKLFLGQLPYIVVTDPKLIEEIGTKKYTSFRDRVPLPLGYRVTAEDHAQFTDNIMWAKGKTWISMRSATEPLFNTGCLETYADSMHRSINQWIQLLRKQSTGGAAVDVVPPMNGVAMSVLGRATFGVSFDQLDKPDALMEASFANMDPPPVEDKQSTVTMLLAQFLPSSKYWMPKLLMHGLCNSKESARFAELEGFMNGATKALINSAKTKEGASYWDRNTPPQPTKKMPFYLFHQQQGQAKGFKAYEAETPSDGSFIPRLLAAKIKEVGQEPKSLTDQQICAQAYTLILAGYDSPANAMSHTLYELAKSPEVQKKLVHEVDAVLKGKPATVEDQEALVYTEAAFQEALRLHHAGNPMYSPCRVCTEDVELGGYVIPQGVGVMLNMVGMAHDDKWFPRHQEYLPERHIPGTPDIGPETRPATCHIPFGYGPHRCVGRKFAIQEAVFLLSRFFQEFTVTLDESKHPVGHTLWAKTGITFQPATGIYLKLHPRKAEVVAGA